MITIIICSVNPDYLGAVKQNIDATIGVLYELLAVDNRNSSKGICQVYNEAAAMAQYPYLCFVHEDVRFHTNGWGKVLVHNLSIPENVLLGVSGAVYKSDIPGSWVDCDKQHYRSHTLQYFSEMGLTRQLHNPDKLQSSVVAVIDGVMMATRKSTWEKQRFDADLLTGFHGYDLDYSLQAGMTGRVLVSHEILLEHFSQGSFSGAWLHDTLLVHRKWKHILPRHETEPGKRDPYSDYISCVAFLTRLLQVRSNRIKAIYYYLLLNVRYFRYNRFRFSKAVFRYLFLNKILRTST
ncbi:MAG TPA: glycosyltransferase [Lacibacter sp.]|nr:glycosyltransferase [Lacibacter sp.]HMO88663.1 glycosyltransferase [Lacibacter sp.]